jgi:transcription antitermination factor NusG
MTGRWHVAVTEVRRERESAGEIAKLGFPTFAPMERRKRFVRGRRVYYERALFPRYIFARFNADDPHWNTIRDVDGICDILCNNGKPCPVPVGLTEKLQRMQKLGLFDHTKAPQPFPPGSIVALDDDGPFAELVGKVLRVRAGDRVDLLIKYLNRELTINVGLARLSNA